MSDRQGDGRWAAAVDELPDDCAGNYIHEHFAGATTTLCRPPDRLRPPLCREVSPRPF
jgi:hypothetical protein